MRTKIYRFLVNRVPEIEVRYHDIRRKNSGIMGRIYSWCALISMNISWAFGKGSIQNSSKNLFLLLEEMEKAEPADGELIKTLQKKLKKIDTRTILDDIGMAEMPLIIYLLYLKYNGDISLLPLGEHDMAIEADGISVANMSYLAVYIHLIEVRPNIIHLEGNVSIPSVFAERCRFVILNNDKEVSCRMEDYGLDLAKGGHVYEKRTAFIADIPLQAGDNNLVFANEIDGITCYYGKINAMRFSPLADCIPGQYCVRQGRILYIDQNVLKCIPSNPETLARFEKTFAEEIRKRIPEKSDWIIGLRNEAYSEKAPKPIWLFMDRVDRADDNAEALFRYVRQIKEIDSYFIIDGESSDYHRLKELGNVVKLYSDRHFRLLLKADYIISSQSNGAVENPFWDDAEYFRDLYHRAKIIFLQHGVIKDDMSPTLSRFNTNFRGFVTSTYKEWESVLKYPYHYTKKEVWLTGLPRFDYLYNNPQNYILIMPTWRQGLMEQVWDKDKQTFEWQVKEDFLESEYVQRYISLLNNKDLQEHCLRCGYKIAFMPHALMEPYIDKFISGSSCIHWDREKSYRDAFAEGSILVTDYSSVAFDFAYLNKPVLYYQFDRDEFFTKHTYKQGYFDYEEDGLGKVCRDEAQLVNELIYAMENDCKVAKPYEDRIKQLFANRDQNNCKRVYECIMHIDEQ